MRKFLTNPIKFSFLTLGAALIAALLRSLAIALAFKGNYFTDSPLAITQTVVTVVFAAALVLLPLTVAKPSVTPCAPKKHAPFTKLTAALAALCLFLCFISSCVAVSTLTLPVLLPLIAFPSLLAGIVYFVLHFFEKSVSLTAKTVFGSILLLAFAVLICFTYFDIGTQMNAPHKVSQHLALLSMMLWLLYDMRAAANAPRPRAQAALTPLTLYLCLTNGISNIVGYIAGKYTSSLFFATDLLLLVFALFIVARTKEIYSQNN